MHPIHSMFGSRLGFSGSANRMAIFADRQNQRWRLTAILELPPSWNDGAVARNPGVSWAFLFLYIMPSASLNRQIKLIRMYIIISSQKSTVVASYFAEWIEERLKSACILCRLDFVNVDSTTASQRPIGAHVAVQHVVVAAVSSWSQIL